MKKTLLGLGLLAILVPAVASAESPADYEAYARYEAKVNGVNAEHLVATLRCESHFNANAIGDGGDSYGLAQIHLPSHPNISPEQALDGYWAIDWTIQQFYIGNAKLWSCWKRLYG